MRHLREYLVPESVDEAVRLWEEAGPGALYIAGGTTIVPAASRGVRVLIDISRLGLDGVRIGNGAVKIGSTTRLSELVSPEVEQAVPMLYRAARSCATPQIRNMATVGGALSGIFLPSDIGIPLLALGSKVTLQGGGRRTVALEELLPGKWPPGDDLIVEIEFPLPGDRTACGFAKFTRTAIDIGLVNIAVVMEVSREGRVQSMRVAVGQSTSPPALLKAGDLPGAGEPVSEDLVWRIAGTVRTKVKARSDSRASSEYRSHLMEVLAARAISDAVGGLGVGIGD